MLAHSDNEAEQTKLKEGVFDLKHGYRKGCLLPTLTVVGGVFLCAFTVRHFCIERTIFDRSGQIPADRDIFYDAQKDHSDGNLDSAAKQVQRILAKQPNHVPANQLMARIEPTRGNRASAIQHLRRSLDSSINRDEVAKWIATLEASEPK